MLFMSAAVEQRFERDARTVASHDQRTDSFRPMKFVRAQRQQIDRQLSKIDRNFADRLHRITVQQHATLATDTTELGNRVDRANLVVREHHGDERRRRLDRVTNLLRINTGTAINRQDRDLDPLPPQSLGDIEHRRMLGRVRHELCRMAALGRPTQKSFRCRTAGGGHPTNSFDRQVVRFRRATREDDPIRRTIQQPRDLPTRTFDCLRRSPTESVIDAGSIAVLLREVRQHRGQHFRSNSRRGVIVEVDHAEGLGARGKQRIEHGTCGNRASMRKPLPQTSRSIFHSSIRCRRVAAKSPSATCVRMP